MNSILLLQQDGSQTTPIVQTRDVTASPTEIPDPWELPPDWPHHEVAALISAAVSETIKPNVWFPAPPSLIEHIAHLHHTLTNPHWYEVDTADREIFVQHWLHNGIALYRAILDHQRHARETGQFKRN